MSHEKQRHSLEVSVGFALSALRDIKNRTDCDYIDEPERDRPRPCTCSHCIAEHALDLTEGGWRFIGAHAGRMRTMPRERKIMKAWKGFVTARILGQILSDLPSSRTSSETPWEQPTPRDWFVATSVVQWLATNVGIEVLRNAGFTYTEYVKDREEIEAREDAEK